MNLLITAEDAIRLAFPANGPIDVGLITGSKIRAAQSKYIRPAFPAAFYEKLCAGEYAEFAEQYVRPALAHFVRYTVIPDMAVQVGNLGAFTADPRYGASATDKQREMLRAQALDDGQTLLAEAAAELDGHPDRYPDYVPQRPEAARVTVAGGIVFRRPKLRKRRREDR